MYTKPNAATKQDIYTTVTNSVLEHLEKGVKPWSGKEWKAKGISQDTPHNPFTGRSYSGVNVLMLWLAALSKGYASNSWATYKQIQEAGGQVRKGEKAARVVFFKRLEVKDAEASTAAAEGGAEGRFIPLMREYAVFNAAQCDGLTMPGYRPLPPAQRIGNAEQFLSHIGAKVQHGGDVAAFYPAQDFISLPFPQSFTSPEAYYAVSLHEHSHWTGHKDRLARDLRNKYGSEAYAFEELIAELGAAFLCAELGIQSDIENHASYLANWCRIMREDHRAVFRASAAAAKAAEFLKAKQPLRQQAAA